MNKDKLIEKLKKNKRKLAYIGIVGGMAVATFALFTTANYFKAKLKSSESQVMASQNILDTVGWESINDTESIYHDKAQWYYDIYQHFKYVSKDNSTAYITTSVFAYTFSILTLVSFGLVLKDADKRKEKEE